MMPEAFDRVKVLRWRNQLRLTLPHLIQQTQVIHAANPDATAEEIAQIVVEDALANADPKFDWSSVDWAALIAQIVALIQLFLTIFAA
jgi:hypothetical protein